MSHQSFPKRPGVITDGYVLTFSSSDGYWSPKFLSNTDPTANGLRLTLSTGVPITIGDVIASTIYLTPYTSNFIALWTGGYWTLRETNEVSLALSGLTSDKNYDVFAYWTGSAVALELSTAWTNDTTRATALAKQNGVLVKTGDSTRKYIGTIRSISASTTTDAANQRFLWNYYNRTERTLKVIDSTTSWNDAGTSWRQARGSTDNKFEYVCGDPITLTVEVLALAQGSVDGLVCSVGVGIDSTTTNSADLFGKTTETTNIGSDQIIAKYRGTPSVGYHAINWLERVQTTVTFFGALSLSAILFAQSGMTGVIRG